MRWRITAGHAGLAAATCLVLSALWPLLTVAPAGAEQPASTLPDPHAVFEQRCKSCHTAHGADLARLNLVDKDGALRVTRSGQALSDLLKAHHGVRLNAAQTSSLVDMMRRGLASGGVFQHRCATCHDKAVTLARDRLHLDGAGTLRTRAGDKSVADMLKDHGGATPEEAGVLLDMLAWQLRTQPR